MGTMNNVRSWLATGRYFKLPQLQGRRRLAGVVVHDDVGAFDIKNIRVTRRAVDIGTRFRAYLGSRDDHCVLLVGSGMGCTGSSIIAHELALQAKGVPILKIGTCVSMHPSYEVGTILIPQWAVADEGVTEWDGRIRQTTRVGAPHIREVFTNRTAVAAHRSLRRKWSSHIEGCDCLRRRVANTNCQIAVWSSDAFYPLLLRPDFVEYLAQGQGHMIQLRGDGCRRKVAKVLRGAPARNCKRRPRLAAWDMECAALFSAGDAGRLEVAAGLVVSWSSKHWSDIGRRGSLSRTPPEQRIAHKTEAHLIRMAIDCLLTSDE